MKKIILAIILAACWLGFRAAHAQTVPYDFMGVNHGRDPVATPYPSYAPHQRIWNAGVGATAHATFWDKIETAQGVYNWSNLDAILDALRARGARAIYTLGFDTPFWASATRDIETDAKRQSVATFVTALMQHVSARGQCFYAFEPWNEANNGTTWWVGSDEDVARVMRVVYPIVKAACPGTIVEEGSNTIAGDPSSKPWPSSAVRHMQGIMSACATGPACFDVVNMHAYLPGVSLGQTNDAVKWAPELTAALATQVKAVAIANGFGSLPVHFNEGYVGDTGASAPADNDAWAASQAIQTLLLASAGAATYDPFSFGTYCVTQVNCANLAGSGPLGLSRPGLALREVTRWLAGATFTAPLARARGANLITVAPNAAGVATGKIAGPGGCANEPAGTGSLPTGWTLQANGSGVSYYVLGSGTLSGAAYIDLRICGTDATSGSGTSQDQIRFADQIAAVTGDNVTLGMCWELRAGSLSGFSEFGQQVSEYSNVMAYQSQFGLQANLLPIMGAPAASQCYETRYQMLAAGAANLRPYISWKRWYDAGAPIAADATIRIMSPALDKNATQWTGAISKPGGYAATIAWEASDTRSTVTVPAGTVRARDMYGQVYQLTPGASFPLRPHEPVIFETR